MTKLEAINEVIKNGGKVVAVAPTGNLMTCRGMSVVWNFDGGFVGCNYLLSSGYEIKDSDYKLKDSDYKRIRDRKR